MKYSINISIFLKTNSNNTYHRMYSTFQSFVNILCTLHYCTVSTNVRCDKPSSMILCNQLPGADLVSNYLLDNGDGSFLTLMQT